MATGSVSPFRPVGTAGVNAGSTSANVPLAGAGESVVVTNTSGALAYVRFGADPSVSATAADMPVLPNARVVLGVNPIITHGAALLSSGNGLVLFTRGDGAFL
jgi:hypothetical protein